MPKSMKNDNLHLSDKERHPIQAKSVLNKSEFGDSLGHQGNHRYVYHRF